MDQFSKDSFVPEGDDSPAPRKKARDSLFLVADMLIEGRPEAVPVRIRNLSSGGLMAEYPHPVDIGALAEIDLRGIGKVTGKVAWTAAGRIGVSFDTPIDPKQARKPVSAPQSGPRKDKPIKSFM